MSEQQQLPLQYASKEWMQAARLVIECFIEEKRSMFTNDDVWDSLSDLNESTLNPRALGPVIREFILAGKIKALTCECCGQTKKVHSRRPECHRREIPVYTTVVE